MKLIRLKYLFFIAVTIMLSSCASKKCKGKASIPDVPRDYGLQKKLPTQKESLEIKKEHIIVYKYDGSLQCGMQNGVDLKIMKEELKGIEVFNSSSKMDGLMHISLCNSPTGMTNRYEIHKSNLKKVEKLGYKKWNFDQ